MRFIGFGALNLDRLYKVQRIAHGDEEVAIQETVEEPGGSAANTIYALGKLNMPTGFLGAVGTDAEGQRVLRSLNEVGVDTSRIRIKDNARTGVVIGFIDSSGERALYIASGANNNISLGDLDIEYLKKGSVVHMTSFVEEEQLVLQKRAAQELGGSNTVKLSFAPGSLYVKRGLSAISPIIERSHVLFLNEAEAKMLMDSHYESASQSLLGMGCEIVAITLAEKGCYITDGTHSEHVDAMKTKITDTTGAGDAFCAGFLYGLAHGRDVMDCGLIGNYLASKCISELGARGGLPAREEFEDGLEKIL